MALAVWPLCAGVAFLQEPAAVAGPGSAGSPAVGDVGSVVAEPVVARPVVVAEPVVATAVGVGPIAGAAVTGVGSTRLPAVEVVTARKVRHDWYLGFQVGLGAGNLHPRGGVLGGGVAITTLLRGGGRLTDRVALGALGLTSLGGDVKAVAGFSNLLAEAMFFPIAGRGLGVAVALGLSSAWVRVPGSDGALIDKSTKFGGAFGLGVGYDFWLARRFNLGVWLRGDGSAGLDGLRASGTLGLSFSWF